MKSFFLTIWIAICLFSCRQEPEGVTGQLRLSIHLEEGYGPFEPGFGIINDISREDSTWNKTYASVRGLPERWERLNVSHVELNLYQFVYQNYLMGNMPVAGYQSLQQSWRWVPDTSTLSEKPIKCYVYVIRGYDPESGKWAAMVDTNNNLDFSDETAIYPQNINPADPYSYKDPVQIQYEVYQNGKVIPSKLPMVLKMYNGDLLYNFPQHAVATFERAGKTHELVVSHGFIRPDYTETDMMLPLAFDFIKRGQEELIKKAGMVEIDGVKFRNKGVDVYSNQLVLEPISSTETVYPLQVGYAFRPFAEKDFRSGRVINSVYYRGKYVFIDFWATSCRGCVADMPALKKVYAGLDKNRVEFIGIANDNPEKLKVFINKHQIAWPQILVSDKFLEIYNVVGFPTSVLLDPEGKIIGKNMRPEELDKLLNE